MKKCYFYLLFILVAILTIGCVQQKNNDTAIKYNRIIKKLEVKDIQLIPSEYEFTTIQLNHSLQLKYKEIFKDGTDAIGDNRAINWYSDSDNILIDDHGVITAVKVTDANSHVTITADYFDKYHKSIQLTVMNKKPNTFLKTIQIKPTSEILMHVIMKGGKKQLQAIGTYSDQTTKDITQEVKWVSSDNRVVTVGEHTGLLEGKGDFETSATITVTFANSNYVQTPRVNIKVKKNVILFIKSTENAFAALREDGTVVAWGNPYYGGNASKIQNKLINIKNIYSNKDTFVALTKSNKVVSWGQSFDARDNINDFDHVKSIYTTAHAFAAIRENGSVVVWGDKNFGGDKALAAKSLKNNKVKTICSNRKAFAALKENGSVVVWGDPFHGGVFVLETDSKENPKSELSIYGKIKLRAIQRQLSSGVVKIYSNQHSFAALKKDGSVVLWGNPHFDASKEKVQAALNHVKTIYSTDYAFAALKKDGSVVVWDDPLSGGSFTLGYNTESLTTGLTACEKKKLHIMKNALCSGVMDIYSNSAAFAALKDDGSVVAWGDPLDGGSFFVEFVGALIMHGLSANGKDRAQAIQSQLSSEVIKIYSDKSSFAALKKNGSVVSWGYINTGNYNYVTSPHLTRVKRIYTTGSAFAALKQNGTVSVWGNKSYGGDPKNVPANLNHVEAIYSNLFAFAALKSDGSVDVWGNKASGGDISRVKCELTNTTTSGDC